MVCENCVELLAEVVGRGAGSAGSPSSREYSVFKHRAVSGAAPTGSASPSTRLRSTRGEAPTPLAFGIGLLPHARRRSIERLGFMLTACRDICIVRNMRTIQRPSRPTTELFTAYQVMFDFFNAELFDGRLPSAVLNFSRRRREVGGFFAPKRWESGRKSTHEISLNPANLKVRTPKAIAATLVHEMVHLQQQEQGKPSRAGYHNREWADMMDAVGLVPSSTGNPGGNRVGQRMTHYIAAGGRFDRAFQKMMLERRRAGSNSRKLFPWQCIDEHGQEWPMDRDKVKYSCEGCEVTVNVWGKPGLSIVCGCCGQPFHAVLRAGVVV